VRVGPPAVDPGVGEAGRQSFSRGLKRPRSGRMRGAPAPERAEPSPGRLPPTRPLPQAGEAAHHSAST
jgi:hypothetical protein